MVHANESKTVVVTQPTYYYQAQPAPAAAPAPVAVPATSPKTAEQKLAELKGLFDKGLIDKTEYDTKKAAILKSM